MPNGAGAELPHIAATRNAGQEPHLIATEAMVKAARTTTIGMRIAQTIELECGLIVGIDRFMSEARALTNFTGNAVATVLVGTWTRQIDKQQVERVLSGAAPFDERTMSADDHAGSAVESPERISTEAVRTIVDPERATAPIDRR